MSDGIKRTRSEIISAVSNLNYVFIDEYTIDISNKRKVVVQDNLGYKYDVGLNSFLSTDQGIEYVGTGNPFTLENISLWLKLNRPEYELCENNTYIRANKKLKFYHSYCDEYFYMSWNAIHQKQGCPVCAGKQIGAKTSLDYLRPDLAIEWSLSNVLLPTQVTLGSHKKVCWICSNCGYGKNNEWKTAVKSRAISNHGCPSCVGQIVSDKNRLSIFCPKISSEWHPTKNENLTPNDVSYGSEKKVWWICNKGHEYFSSVGNRKIGKGCPYCSEEKRESSIATELKKYCIKNYKATKKENREFINPETNRSLPFDIYIPKWKIFIEVNGLQHYKFVKYWHINKNGFEYQKKKDIMKRVFARKNGTYIEVDLRKIKTIFDAIVYVDKILEETLL